MSGFVWFLLILAGSYLGLRVFGRRILLFAAKRLTRRLMKQAEHEAQAFTRNYEEDNRANVYVDQEIKVSAPKNQTQRPVHEEEIVEDIEFEDVSSEEKVRR